MLNKPYNPILFDSYFRDMFIRVNFFFSLLLNILIWLGIVWQMNNFSESMPLHYNIYFGIDLLGDWYQIFILPGLGLLFFLINFIAGFVSYHKEKIISYFLAGTASFCQLILLVATALIIFINY